STDGVVRYPLQNGSLAGIWTQLSADNHRAWYYQVRPAIASRNRLLRDALMGEQAEPTHASLDEAPPRDVLAEAERLVVDDNTSDVARALHAVPGGDRVSTEVAPFPANHLDFAVL